MTISSKLFATQMLDQFKLIENRLQNLNTQIATGTRITKSSDAPLDAVTLTARRELEARLEQYQSNAGKVTSRLELADTTLHTVGTPPAGQASSRAAYFALNLAPKSAAVAAPRSSGKSGSMNTACA